MTSKRDLVRFDKLQRIGCIACRTLGVYSPADVHHILSGGRRIGHQATIPLCPWHHRAAKPFSEWEDDMLHTYGPSLAHGSKPFEARFGTQFQLLAMVNELVKEHA